MRLFFQQLERAAMIKRILVHIPTERPIRPVIDASISLAQQFGAELDALSLGYISTGAAFVVEGAAATVLAANLDLEERRPPYERPQRLLFSISRHEMPACPIDHTRLKAFRRTRPTQLVPRRGCMICRSSCNRMLIITHLTTRSLGTSCCRPADRCFSFLTFSTGLSSPNALGSAGTEVGLHREPFVMPILFSPGPTTCARCRSTHPTLHRPRRRSRS